MGKEKPVYFVGSRRVGKGDLREVLEILLREAEFHAYKRYRRQKDIPDEELIEDLASFETPLLHNLVNQIEDAEEAKGLLRQGLGMLLDTMYEEVLDRAREFAASEGPKRSQWIH